MIVGIDPGVHGALAWFDEGELFDVVDLPTVMANKTGKKQVVSDSGLAAELEKAHDPSKLIIIIERQTAGSGNIQGRPVAPVAIGTQMRSYGIIEGVTAALKCERHFVMPAVWKRRMGLTSDKELSRARALQLWPQHADKFKYKKNEGRAEAALLALYQWQAVELPAIVATDGDNFEESLATGPFVEDDGYEDEDFDLLG